jgi:hypothetical protein
MSLEGGVPHGTGKVERQYLEVSSNNCIAFWELKVYPVVHDYPDGSMKGAQTYAGQRLPY